MMHMKKDTEPFALSTSSMTECTGLMQTLPENEQEAEAYEALYQTHWPKVDKELEQKLLHLEIENAFLKELRRLRLEEEATKSSQGLSAVSEENTD